MSKKIVLVLVAAVLLLGAAAVFESVAVSLWKMPVFDPEYPKGGTPPTPDGDPLPPGPL